MGVRTHEAEPRQRPRAAVSGPGPAAIVLFFVVALVLLVANGRPIGEARPAGAAAWLLGAALALGGRLFDLDATGREVVGKLLAALFAAAAGTALFAAVSCRHGTGEGRWAGFALVLGTTLTAAAQAFSGEAPAACAVAIALWLLVRADAAEDGRLAAASGLPLGLAAALQPSTLVLALVLAAGALWRRPRALLPLLLWSAPGAALAAFVLLQAPPAFAGAQAPAGVALLASPAKGAFVFAPVGLVGLAGLGRALLVRRARLWDEAPPSLALPVSCGLAFLAHLSSLVALGGWADGVFWGPRLVAAAWPLLLLFLPEGLSALKLPGTLLVLISIGVQALGTLGYDGRWDRLHRGPKGELDAVLWRPEQSPIAFQWNERVVRPTYVSVANRRLVVRERTFVPGGTTAGFVSFKAGRMRPTGADPTMEDVRLEAGARPVDDSLELRAAGDGIAFRVREGSRIRRLELRLVGSGHGVIGVGESRGGHDGRWRERTVAGAFRLRFPYSYASSNGPDLVVALRSGGPLSLRSLALVPPSDPENVIRLP